MSEEGSSLEDSVTGSDDQMMVAGNPESSMVGMLFTLLDSNAANFCIYIWKLNLHPGVQEHYGYLGMGAWVWLTTETKRTPT